MKQDDFDTVPGGKHAFGKAVFRLDIDSAGKVTGCTVIASGLIPAMNARLCELMLERALFRPGLGADGKPVASSYTTSMMWYAAGDGTRVPLRSWSRTATYQVDPDGRLVSCDISDEGGDPGEPLFMCDVPMRYRGGWQSNPPQPQTRRFVRSVSIEVEGHAALPDQSPDPDGVELDRDQLVFDVRTDGTIPQCKDGCRIELRYLPQQRRARAVRTETVWLVEGDVD